MSILRISYSKKRDFDLWQSFKSGDRDALDHIFYTYIKLLINYSKKFTKDNDLIDDCIQEMFLDLWLKREQLGDTDSIKPYLFKTLRRRVFLEIQRTSKIKETVQMLNSEMDFEATLESPLTTENTEYLNRVFNVLTPLQREVIYLKYYNNLSFEEISGLLDINKKTLYNYLSKAMLTFRKHLKSHVNSKSSIRNS